MSADSRGVIRGKCRLCACSGYNGGSEKKKCESCLHLPGQHFKLDSVNVDSVASEVIASTGVTITSTLVSEVEKDNIDISEISLDSERDESPDLSDQIVSENFEEVPMKKSEDSQSFSRKSPENNKTNGKRITPRKTTRYFDGLKMEDLEDNKQSTPKAIPRLSLYHQKPSSRRAGDGVKMEDLEDDEQASPVAKPRPSLFSLFQKPLSTDFRPTHHSLGQPTASIDSSAGFVKKTPRTTNTVHKLGPKRVLGTKRSDSILATSQSPFYGNNATMKAISPRKDDHARPVEHIPHLSMLPMNSPPPMTKICKLDGCSKPAWVEGSRVHDYCGLSHYRLGTGQSEEGDVSEELICSTPGCKRQKYKTPQGGYFDYCSKGCRDRYRSSQLCQPVASVVGDVCRITRATRDQYNKLRQQFLSAWVKGDPPPLESISVYIITNPVLEQKWQAYKDQLSDTTIETHYHGTKLCCDVSSLRLCNNKSCGICGIAQNNFDHTLIGSNISRFKRFGDAFYLAPNSSKCHDYTVGYGQHRAMLCFQTLPGRKYTLKKTNVKFVLPSGYDSAYGEPGQSLNYPELLLYKSESALPMCIFMYKKDGIEQIAK